jgi:hypothetical protein
MRVGLADMALKACMFTAIAEKMEPTYIPTIEGHQVITITHIVIEEGDDESRQENAL